MPKKGSVKVRAKAVKKLDKAVKRAMRKGVPEQVLERTINVTMEKVAIKEAPVKRRTARAANSVRSATKTAEAPDLDHD